MASTASNPLLTHRTSESKDRPDKRPYPGSQTANGLEQNASEDEDDFEDEQDRQSVLSHDNSTRDSTSQPPTKTRKKPGRKPNPASPAVRKEQNRAAQRAFRDRKERHLQQLENMIKELKDTHHHAGIRFQRESQQLKSIIESLQSENYYLREVVFSFESALGKTGNAAILQDVKAELYRRHYENHAARKLSMSGPSQHPSPSVSKSSISVSTPIQAPAPTPVAAPVAVPSTPAPAPVPAPMVMPGPVPVDDSIPHATQVQMLNQALAAAMAAHAANAAANANSQANRPNNYSNNHNANSNQMTMNDIGSAASSSSSSSSNAWTQLGLADPQDDNIFSMNSDILYKAPTLFSNTDDTKMHSPIAPSDSSSGSRNQFPAPNWLPKQSSVYDDLQSTLFSQNNIQSSSNKMSASPQNMTADNLLFGQPQESFSPNQNMFTFTTNSMDNGFSVQTPSFLDSDDVDSNEFSMATPNMTFDDHNLKQDIIPSYRLQMELRILASAPPATDPNIDPKIYALPHDSRIDLIPCPKLRAQMIMHQNEYDIEDLCQLLIGGAICHGHPLDPHNWELPRAFFDRYGYLMGQELMKYKNKVWPKKADTQRQNLFRTY
ncbi:hypothetical protein BGW39_011782 [Mortierella sp. 14UC]|nr:hypothetical protein BGW39_011782 [Mortierella sp. 14UC]